MQPNILICVIDALRADRVGVLGGRELTPAIDTFANDAAIFSEAFTTINTTDPAITSIQTGRYPLSHGVLNHGWRVSDEEKRKVQTVSQLPELLSEAGYRTAKFGRPLGRWHRNGFDRYPEMGEWRDSNEVDLLTAGEIRISSWLANINPYIRDAASFVYERTGQRIRDFVGSEPSNEEIGRSNIVDDFRSFVDSEPPFFAFVHLMDTHVPYQVNPDYTSRCLDKFEYENTPLVEYASMFPEGSFSHERLQPGGRIYETASSWDDTAHGIGTAVVNAQYDAAVQTADKRVGNILEVLRKQDLLDETLVFLLSDHGESLTEHDILYDHHGLYDPSVRIPFIVRPPGGIDRHVYRDFVQVTDILPTVRSYTSINSPSIVNGSSLRPTIENGDSIGREIVLAEEAHTQRRRMIRSEEEKLIYSLNDDLSCRYCEIKHAGPEEFYLIGEDTTEHVNRVSDFPRQTDQFRQQAEGKITALSDQSPDELEDQVVEYEDEQKIYDRLEELGYK